MSDRRTDKPQASEPDYEVGYGRPPKASQFKPGQSGNPKGRRRRPKSVREQTQSILARKITITEGGHSKKLTLQDVILRAQAQKAVKGDLKAAAFLLHLINAPEFADTDVIDEDALSPDEQAMINDMIRQFSGAASEDVAAQAAENADLPDDADGATSGEEDLFPASEPTSEESSHAEADET
jgi:hypothetical protein